MSQFADRIRETTATTGAGTVNLAGAEFGYRTFVAGVGASKPVIYSLIHRAAAEWEVGLGVVTDATPDTLSRLIVLASSNSGSLVNFSAGIKDAICAWTAFTAVSTNQLARRVTVATTADITLSGEQTIDGVLTSGSRVLVKNQSTASQNGIYVSSSGAWVRAVDCYTGDTVGGQIVIVEQGTAAADSVWLCTNNAGADVVATASLAYTQVAGTGVWQPLDADLTAIAALTTTSFGRGLLALADAAALRSAASLGTVATLASDTDGTLAANSNSNVATQAAVKTYVDGLVAGLKWKQSVRVATTANGTLASDFENGDTVDGVTLATGDRILIKDQSTAAENGIYVVAASGAPARATDADSGAELVNATVMVEAGTTNADTQWTCTTNATITVGVTSIAWAAITAGVSIGDGAVSTAKLADDAVTYAKMQNVSTTKRVLARKTAGAGDVEECTVEEILDFIASAVQGDVLFRGPSGWIRKPAATVVATDGATVTFDLSAGNHHQVTLGGNRTLAVSNEYVGQNFMVDLIQDGTGSRSATWWSGITWLSGDGSAPVLPTGAGKIYSLGFRVTGSGTYNGYLLGANGF